jgi:hypothetical protein
MTIVLARSRPASALRGLAVAVTTAELFGELDHVAADGSSGTVDQDRLSRRECGEIKQCLHVDAWIPAAVKVAHDAPVA